VLAVVAQGDALFEAGSGKQESRNELARSRRIDGYFSARNPSGSANSEWECGSASVINFDT
jgi:hypothetical protein